MINRNESEIIKNWETTIPLVSIKCMAYNEAPFISQALDGFLMQETDFPFDIIVHDDASTDGTDKIIREYEKKYPKIIKAIYETENQYSKHDGSLRRVVEPYVTGKYVAFCEGDDYWIDPHKLQKQVNFLEKHPDYGMCYTRARVYKESTKSFSKKAFGGKTSLKDTFCHGGKIPTPSVCIRNEIREKYIEEIHPEIRKWRMGDLPLWMYTMIYYKAKFIPNFCVVYRIREESASHHATMAKSIEFLKNARDIRNFFKEKYDLAFFINNDETVRFDNYFSRYCRHPSKENLQELNVSYKDIKEKRFRSRIKYIIAHFPPLKLIYSIKRFW